VGGGNNEAGREARVCLMEQSRCRFQGYPGKALREDDSSLCSYCKLLVPATPVMSKSWNLVITCSASATVFVRAEQLGQMCSMHIDKCTEQEDQQTGAPNRTLTCSDSCPAVASVTCTIQKGSAGLLVSILGILPLYRRETVRGAKRCDRLSSAALWR
jgi:hypothetical protein